MWVVGGWLDAHYSRRVMLSLGVADTTPFAPALRASDHLALIALIVRVFTLPTFGDARLGTDCSYPTVRGTLPPPRAAPPPL